MGNAGHLNFMWSFCSAHLSTWSTTDVLHSKDILSDSDIENGGFRDLFGSEKVREC